jgi:hypothetical protein
MLPAPLDSSLVQRAARRQPACLDMTGGLTPHGHYFFVSFFKCLAKNSSMSFRFSGVPNAGPP